MEFITNIVFVTKWAYSIFYKDIFPASYFYWDVMV